MGILAKVRIIFIWQNRGKKELFLNSDVKIAPAGKILSLMLVLNVLWPTGHKFFLFFKSMKS